MKYTTTPAEVEGKKLLRITAAKDFGHVKAGTVGGYVENENNLSHEDTCWIDAESVVTGTSLVAGNAQVVNSRLRDCKAHDDALVANSSAESSIFDGSSTVVSTVIVRSRVHDEALVMNSSLETSVVAEWAAVLASRMVKANASSKSVLKDSTAVESSIWGEAYVKTAELNRSDVNQFAVLYNVDLRYMAVAGKGLVSRRFANYLVIGPAKSSGRFTNAHFDAEIGVRCNTGCFSGSVRAFEEAIVREHANNLPRLRQYLSFANVIKETFTDYSTQALVDEYEELRKWYERTREHAGKLREIHRSNVFAKST